MADPPCAKQAEDSNDSDMLSVPVNKFYDNEKDASSSDSLLSFHSDRSGLPEWSSWRFQHATRKWAGLLACLMTMSIVAVGKMSTSKSVSMVNLATTNLKQPLCTVDSYEKGKWRLKETPPLKFLRFEDILGTFDSPGQVCTFNEAWFNYGMHTPSAERLTQVMSYDWDAGCSLVKPSVVQQIQWLIDEGGWLLVGDSLTREQFAQLSCVFGHHMQWSSRGAVDHHEASQHLTLNPASPVIPLLRLPEHFDMGRPLITYQRADLLYSRKELLGLLQASKPNEEISFDTNHIVNKLYSIESSRYMDQFTNPYNQYSTLVVSTGAHWTLKTLNATSNDQLLEYFDVSMQDWLSSIQKRMTRSQKMLVRAATPGHAFCERHLSPLQQVQPIGDFYNWRLIPTLNEKMRHFVEQRRSKQIRWLGGERPARLRPDAHNSDCLHVTLGAGIVEGWIAMIWQSLLT